jgi:hypothetical protein
MLDLDRVGWLDRVRVLETAQVAVVVPLFVVKREMGCCKIEHSSRLASSHFNTGP